ncbi:MAG TPA: DUF4214 domain-containing protein [Pirellulales bacterium]|nr:DUF4214 domain-containing protein [Pirellulales bacterium]
MRLEALETRHLLSGVSLIDAGACNNGNPPPPCITTNAGGAVVLGSGNMLGDTATLSGGNCPTGTLTFYLFAPGVIPNATDSNNVYSDTVTVDGDGTYSTDGGTDPGGYLPTVTGKYQWLAVYGGDANNGAVASNFCDEPECVTPAQPNITTVPGGPVVLGGGDSLTDTATLAGGSNPTGTITFYLFAPGVTPAADNGNNVYSDTVTVSGDGTYSTSVGTDPGGYVPNVAGTYQWVAAYSGDANNCSAASNFGDEPECVTPPSPPSTQVDILKIADQQSVDAGQTAGFTIEISNVGANTATGLTLNDPLPAGYGNDIHWQIDSSGMGYGAGTQPADFVISGPVGNQVLTLASSVNTLAAGASISVNITGQTSLNDVNPGLAPCTTTLVNTATVNASNEPANDQNAQASATITLHSADVDITKTADQSQIVAGQMAGFTIQIYNQGCVDAMGVTLSDPLPEGAANDIYWRLDPKQNSSEYFQIVGGIGQQQLELAPGMTTLQPGALISVHIIGQTSVNDVGNLDNTATVNASNEPSFEDNAQASASIGVEQSDQNNAQQLYVQAAFEQALYRQPDQATLASFVNALDNGMSRATFAMTLTHSSEYYDDVVSQAYEHYLGRTPDATGLQYWNQQLQAGMTDEQLEAQFIGSSEYYQHSGGTDKAWVDHMYFDLLGRTPDLRGETYWVAALAGGASRSSVALGFAASAEREGNIVQQDYETFLGRPASASEVNGWVMGFENGLSNEDVIAGFIASNEFFADHS